MSRFVSLLLPLAVLSSGSIVLAQWPASSATNLAVGDATGEQVVSKIATSAEGGTWLGWFDNRSGAYAVYVQYLDPAGVEQFPHNGLLVSANPQSTSLIDWDLICDSTGGCVLTFTDTRAGGDLDCYAYRLATSGTFLWGANGVTLSNNADFEANPHVCEAHDGDFVFVWTNTVTRTVQMQRLDPGGNPRFPGDGIATPGDAGQTPAFARVAPGAPATGDVVLSWVRASAFTAAKHIHMQKFDSLGQPLWNGGTRIAVFDLASLPIAHDPKLQSDGTGGAIVSWHYAQGSQFFARVQHVTSAGVEVFAHNGVNVTTSAGSTFDPAAVWVPSTQEILVAWNERNLAQSSWGILAQKLDTTGAPQWGAGGVTLLPIDTVVKFAPVAARLHSGPTNDGIAVSVLMEDLGLLQKSVRLFGLTNSGAPAFPPVTACTVASDKLRLAHAATASGTQVLAWTDSRNPTPDLYAAAVDLNGQLGVQLGVTTMGGCGGFNPVGSLAVNGRPAVGMDMEWQMTNPLATQAGGSSLGIFILAFGATGFPCGVPVPGFGMSGAGASGEVLVDTTGAYISFFGGVWAGAPSFVAMPFSMPFDPTLVNVPLYLQGLMVDLSLGAGVVFGLTQGARLVVGS
ncbi:MAG: hypothetical protein JNK78_01750 [Planctomycetes bacterium]|nr:hypothetical protein [Planctomycetota bacterium]